MNKARRILRQEDFEEPIGLDLEREVVEAPHIAESSLTLLEQGYDRNPSDRHLSNALPGVVPTGLEAELKSGKYICNHFGLHFCGDVYWDGTTFVERVNRFWRHVGTHRAKTLAKLVASVNAKWGDE